MSASPGAATRRSFAYQPALDGIRAVAIAAVVLTHSMPHFTGGSLGVDVFFVLSGFLITSLLLDERTRTGRIDLRGFYVRRALRLLPALAFTLCLVAVLSAVLLPTPGGRGTEPTGIAIFASTFYSADFFVASGHSLGYLTHTWSLAVEEQFYLLWPAAFVILAARGKLRRALPWLIVSFALTRALCTTVLGLSPSMTRPLPTSCADELLIGALLAVLLGSATGQRRVLAQPLVGWGSLGAICGAMLVACASPDGAGSRPFLLGGLTITAVAAALLIGHVVTAPDTGVAKLLSRRGMVIVGRVSYGIYLLHGVAFLFVRRAMDPLFPGDMSGLRPGVAARLLAEMSVEYSATALLVVVSWRYVERPALRLKRRLSATAPVGVTPPRVPPRYVGLSVPAQLND